MRKFVNTAVSRSYRAVALVSTPPPWGITNFLCTDHLFLYIRSRAGPEATRALGPGLNPAYCVYPLEGDPVHPLVPKDGSRVWG